MNFIGTIKAGVYIQHLLKDLYCPVEQNQIHNFFSYKLSFQVVPDGLGVLLKPFFVTDWYQHKFKIVKGAMNLKFSTLQKNIKWAIDCNATMRHEVNKLILEV